MMILKLNILIISAVAAWMDIKWWKVKNPWIAAAFAGGICFLCVCSESPGIITGIEGFLIPLVMLGIFYRLGLIGAGDVKLFAVIGLWMGPIPVLVFMLKAFICGVIYALILLVRFKSVERVLKTRVHVAVFAFMSALMYIGGPV